MVKTRKSELHFINLKIPTRLGTKFQLELTILIFLDQIYPQIDTCGLKDKKQTSPVSFDELNYSKY